MPSCSRRAPQVGGCLVGIVDVSFPLQIKGDEAARIATFSLLCPAVAVEWIDSFAALKQVGGAKAPQFAYPDAVNDPSSCVALKGFRVDSNDGCRSITVQQRFE